jgi:hypothetical protein
MFYLGIRRLRENVNFVLLIENVHSAHSEYLTNEKRVGLGLSQDGACTDLFENLSVNSLKGDKSNDTKCNLPLFTLVNIP